MPPIEKEGDYKTSSEKSFVLDLNCAHFPLVNMYKNWH